ncbi:L-aminoadipate-semialdehyde dehydrogenase large subunit [Grifola frondosa]|uniref:L-aminoadipate-semialdehyde dehydrogenase large subunit n=1 Tax=Grifola frondosa TaxID=5627 RepID=A0A1C7MTN6_GRIFR|nr:L-aminoadipate-semialdehyde dehydrogenase large subunit [Grifola frondosa]
MRSRVTKDFYAHDKGMMTTLHIVKPPRITLMSQPSSPLLPDSFIRFCDHGSDEVFCWIAETDSEHPNVLRKTRLELIQDAMGIAIHFTDCGIPRRQLGSPPMNVCMLTRNSYAAFAAFLGLSLSRCAPVLISPRLGLEAVVELVRASQSRYILVDASQSDVASSVQAQVPDLSIISLSDSINSVDNSTLKPWFTDSESDLESEMDSVVYYLHTSGSTGRPKLIPETHRKCGIPDAYVPYRRARLSHPVPDRRTMCAVIIESNQPATGERFCRLLDRFPSAICVVPPVILEEIVHGGPPLLKTLASAHRVLYAGAALSQTVGEELANFGVKLLSAFGTTETGQLTVTDVASEDPHDWPYVRFIDPSQLHLVPVPDSDDLHRLVPGRFLPANLVNQDDPIGFSTGDLWKPHPTKSGLWTHTGRRGSVTVLSNGEKTDNEQIESLIAKDPLIHHVMVFGEGRFQNGVIILPRAFAAPEEVLRSVWPTIEHTNSVIPQHSKLVRELVLVADPQRRFALSDKGTVRRQETLAIYAEEIQNAYAKLENGTIIGKLPEEGDEDGTLRYIRGVVKDVLGKKVEDHVDLFAIGMDSLAAMNARTHLIPLWNLRPRSTELPRNILYHYPTISALHNFLTSPSAPHRGSDLREHLTTRVLETGTFVSHSGRADKGHDPDGLVILLTGSTGHLAAKRCLLFFAHRQRRNMDDPTILDEYASKMTFWNAHFDREDLGLTHDALEDVRYNVTHIVHCAWDVNFNHVLSHFVDTQLAGLYNLINLSLSSHRATCPRILFMSSTAAVANYSGPEDVVPELPHDDTALPLDQGYAQAKYLAERLLIKASEERDLPVTIVRAGQLSGSTVSGAWNPSEHMPILLRSSLILGKIPDHLPDARWTPTDIAAQVLLDILLHDTEADSKRLVVRHIDNALVLPGPTLVHWLVDASNGSLQSISVDAWLRAIRESPLDDIPAKRLLDFFEIWLRNDNKQLRLPLSLEKTRSVSRSLNSAQITPELVTKYFEYVQTVHT